MIINNYLTTYVGDVIVWIKQAFTLAFDGNFNNLTIGQFIFLFFVLGTIIGGVFD